MTTDAEIACPDPHCRLAAAHHAARPAPVQPCRNHGGAARMRLRPRHAAHRLAPDYEISRVIRGGWQMASGHGAVKSDDPVADMVAFADAGITTFDCADIYTGVEELIGRFRPRYRDAARRARRWRAIKVHTKFVPDLDDPASASPRAYVEGVIDQSLAAAEAWSGSTSCSSTGGTMRAALARDGASGSTSCSAPARSTRSARTNFDTDAHAGAWSRRRAARPPCRCNTRCSTPARQAHGRGCADQRRLAASATARSPAGSSATAGSAQPEPDRTSRTAR